MRKHSTSKARRTPFSQTNWERMDTLKDKDIDLSDIPKVTPEQFARAIPFVPLIRLSQLRWRPGHVSKYCRPASHFLSLCATSFQNGRKPVGRLFHWRCILSSRQKASIWIQLPGSGLPWR